MILARVTWGTVVVDRWSWHQEWMRDPVRRGKFLCGVLCNEFGVAARTEGCQEDAELRVFRTAIVKYEEFVL